MRLTWLETWLEPVEMLDTLMDSPRRLQMWMGCPWALHTLLRKLLAGCDCKWPNMLPFGCCCIWLNMLFACCWVNVDLVARLWYIWPRVVHRPCRDPCSPNIMPPIQQPHRTGCPRSMPARASFFMYVTKNVVRSSSSIPPSCFGVIHRSHRSAHPVNCFNAAQAPFTRSASDSLALSPRLLWGWWA